jgi:GAF domain-containing protein
VPLGDAAQALQLLTQVTAELVAADTLGAVMEAAVTHAAEALGAAVATLMLRDEDQLVLVGGQGLQPGVEEEWASFKLADDTPASEAARTGQPVAVPSSEELERRYPPLRGRGVPGRSTLCLPLGAPPANVGALGMTFDEQWLPGAPEMAFLAPFVDACAQAVRRVQAADAAALRERQLRFLADASFELGRSLDYRTTLRRVAELVVPDLADWCSVQILDAGQLVTLAVAHTDPEKVAWAWELQKRFPPPQDSPTGAPAVARTGVSELYRDITEDLLVAGARDAEELELLHELRMRSAIVVPLTAHGRTLGVVTLIRTEHGGARFGPADLAVAEDLGRRAGLAIDNAHLHSETRDVALQLQHAVLPDLPPSPPGWRLAARYEPGGRAEVGGDFFDAVALPDDRLAIVVGDVMGHGLPAAAAMAQVRAAIRGFVTIDPAPGRVIDRLQTMFAQLQITRLVSIIYGVADRRSLSVELVNAGAMPPLLVSPDGAVDYLRLPAGTVLGTDPEPATPARIPLEPNATLLLYTDGLVERRGHIIDEGLEQLRHSAGRHLTHADLDEGLLDLVARFRDPNGHDDVTALAIRCT